MTAPSPRPRRISPPSWFDLRLVVGVLLVLASVALGAFVVSRASDTEPAVVVTRDLAAGTVLSRDDLAVEQVRVADGVYLSAVRGALGRELDRALSKGELLPAAAVHAGPARTTLTVPLETGAAPDLHAGQRIEVWVSTPGCTSAVLLGAVTVQAVHLDGGGSFSTGTGGQDVVIDVDRALAERVVSTLAIDDVHLRAGILAGSAAGPPAEDALPDLAPSRGP